MKILAHIKGSRRSKQSSSRMLTALLLVSALMFGIASLAHAAEVTKIGCEPIPASGQYRLTKNCKVDIYGRGGISIGLGVVDVELDLAGHTISGPGCSDSEAIGITIDGSRVRVTNGTLENLTGGIRVGAGVPVGGPPPDKNRFSRLKVVQNCFGIELRATTKNEISDSEISQNDSLGVLVQGIEDRDTGNVIAFATENLIAFNVIDKNSETNIHHQGGVGGVVLGEAADSNVIFSNEISENQQFGIILIGTSRGKNVPQQNIIASNTLKMNGALLIVDGIRVADGTNNFLVGNIAENNFGTGISLDWSGAIVPQLQNNIVENNKLQMNKQFGIRVVNGSINNFLLGNTAMGNTFGDLEDGNRNPDCDQNIWKNNHFERNSNTPTCIQ